MEKGKVRESVQMGREMKTLRIYETSDIHGFFYPTSYGDSQEKEMGLFRCVAGFEKDENTLYIDTGDILQGSAFSYYCKRVLDSPEAIADIMNACGCDYYTLGNHDFNYGMAYLKKYITHRKGTCICQNVTDEEGNVLYPYAIRTMPNGLRVGLVGIVTDYVNVWEKEENLQGIRITSPFEAAKKAYEELKGQVDVTVCVYHGGFEKDLKTGDTLSDTTENIGYRIATELSYDILLTGHQHMSIDGQYIDNTYVVQPLEYGREYHRLDVTYEEGKLAIISEKRKPLEKASPYLCDKFQKYEDMVQTWLNEPCGHLNQDLLPEERVQMALHGSKIADFFQKVQLYFSKAQISAVGLANEVAGFHKEVTNRDVIATYPYPNTLMVLEITGAQLKRVMERSAEYFTIKEDGSVGISESFLIPKIEHYNYDYYAGIEYEIEPARPVGQRIVNLKFQGNTVKEDDKYSICINNYRSTGAGGYPEYRQCRILKEINVEMVELIMEYFEHFPNVVL